MKSMFVVITILLAVAVILAVEPQRDFLNTVLEASNKCVNKTGLSPSELMQFSMMKTPENNKPFCYLACTAKSIGIMTADNKLNKEKINSTLALFKDELMKTNSHEKIMKVLNTCMDEVSNGGSNECDVAKAGYDCFITNGKKEGIIHIF